jgi:isopentenyldiphosphate isomerase
VNEVWNGLTQSAQPNSDAPGIANYGELLSIFDENERPLGQATSKLAHKIGLWHQSFHAWVIGHDDKGIPFVILQQRGRMKRDFPNCLDISVAGHYRAGEGIEGGVREFKEELGIDVDSGDLVLVARRTIDECLDNGVVNREFQNIYALIQDSGLERYRPGYPEVSAIYQCQLDKLRSVLDGTLEQFECSGLAADAPDGIFYRTRRKVALGDLIPSSHHYLSAVLTRLNRLLNEGVVIAEAEARLPDGSYWKSS